MTQVEILIRSFRRFSFLLITLLLFVIATVLIQMTMSLDWSAIEVRLHDTAAVSRMNAFWRPPSLASVLHSTDSSLIRYGRDLIMHTARYLGPKGSVARISNGMNCTNCHLHGGTKLFAANYSGVAATYPKFRSRSGAIEGFEKRVNDCLQRSLNGDTLARNSKEMKAMVAYIKFIGKDVPRGITPEGAGLLNLQWLHRSADTIMGERYYAQYCVRCHGRDGAGVKGSDGIEWLYPPLWGNDSYNTGAGLFRISKFAAFIKSNMPFGVTHDTPILGDEEAWDIAAYVNSQDRPHVNFPMDWPDISKKPVDHPFGPYSDNRTEVQHKFGPWGLIETRNN